jgi:6-phosphofructokinase 1
MPTIGVPGTIDNDVAGTEATIGFDTAVNTVIEAVDKIRDTAYSHDRTTIIEVMGRSAGLIALWSGLAAGAESILVPERKDDLQQVVIHLKDEKRREKRHIIIIVAEGVCSGAEVRNFIMAETGIDPRVTVLGYIQRGGAPTAADRVLGCRMGALAVDLLAAGKSGYMIGQQAGVIKGIPFEEALLNRHELPTDLYNLALSLAI